MAKVRGHLILRAQTSASLPNLHQELADECSSDYFGLRHFVSTYGEEHGLYFDGASGNDTVSLTPEGERVRGQDVVLKLLRESPRGLTLVELASQIKSKSTPLAKLYLSRLMDEHKAVRVDEMIYTTPEKAFCHIELDEIGDEMDKVISEVPLPIEADALREQVNAKLGLHHSKHLYMAVGRILAERYGWHRRRTIFCREPIPYKGCMNLVREVCDLSASNEENENQIMQHIRMTPQTVLQALNWMRFARRSMSKFED